MSASQKTLENKPPLKTFGQLKIMVAEDNNLMQQTIKLLFSRWGCKPVFVQNGKQAVDSMKANEYDIVLMDINMPEMTGVEAVKEIRTFNTKTPVIAFTTLEGEGHLDLFEKVGMTAYLSKFASPEQIMETILRHIAA